jgi:hypothetical protein
MTKEKSMDISNQVEVLIKKEAFRNMITHVLRFGSELLEKSVEVMGVCLGTFTSTEEKLIIDNAIPVMHGTKVSVGFSKEEIELIQQIENQYKKKIIGWYISRPGWGLDFTEITIANHQYFQNVKFPRGFCVVFDHTLMGLGGNFGFEIYRLDDYTKTDSYSNLSYEIEIPSTLEYFKWIQKFMEDFQKKSPILIKEVNEFVEKVPEDLQEIPTPKKSEQIEESLGGYPEITSLITSFKQGSESFSDVFMNTFQNQIGNWINDIEQGSSHGTEYITKAVDKMKQAVVAGLLKVSGWFKKTLNESTYEFKNSVHKYIDTRIEDHKQVAEEILEVKQNLINNLNNLIENKIKNIDSEIDDLTDAITQKLKETTQTNLKMEKAITELENKTTLINNNTKKFTQDIEEKMETPVKPLQTIFDDKIKKLNAELDPFKNNYSEIKELLEKLQKIITEFRNFT